MKYVYLKSLALASIVFGLNIQSQAQNKREVAKIRSTYNLTKLQEIKDNFQKTAIAEKKQALQIAKEQGWKTKFTTKKGDFVELQKIVNGKPIYYTTLNTNAAKSTRTNHLNTDGSLGLNLMGQGMTAHVWDAGVARITHQEYDGSGGSNRFSVGDGTTTKNYHSGHVTGTIMASGFVAKAKGMAPHAKVVGYDWNNDTSEAITAASEGMLVSNHSYGYILRSQQGNVQLPQFYLGGYINTSRSWDIIAFNAPNYLMVVSAGNDGYDNSANDNPTGGYGYDKLSGITTSKNNLVVANAQDAIVDADGNLITVSISGSSSQGPTDDFRIKPDITGNGSSVYSTYTSGDTAYGSLSGTSMAAPNVSGSLILLQEHYKNLNNGNFMKAATLKGLALHTADDAGFSGPDAIFGWGLLNAKKATEAITNNGTNSKIEELTLNSGETYTVVVDSDGESPLLASISWTDRPGSVSGMINSTTPILINDLDIRVSHSEKTYLPYKLTGATTSSKQDNNVDPFERIDLSRAKGRYTITVTHKGTLTGGSQNFSLIVTGIKSLPTICNITVPTKISTNEFSETAVLVNWEKVIGATYDFRYKAVLASSWIIKPAYQNSIGLSSLSESVLYEIQIRSICPLGKSSYSPSVYFTTSGRELNYCTSKGANINNEYIQKVTLGAINNLSTGGNGYSDYTSISTNLIKGKSNTITITPKWSGNSYNEGYGVWIDYNKDGDFSDSGEKVWAKFKGKETPVSGTFTVPYFAKKGATRMRIILKNNEIPTACERSIDYGEVEDYLVVITEEEDTVLSAPSNLLVSKNGQNSLTLNWSAPVGNLAITSYDIYEGTTKLETVKTTATTITGLNAETLYSFFIKAKDVGGNISEASNVVSIKTLPNNIKYCSSKGITSNYEWIDYVAFGGMMNTTGANDGYGNFTSKVATVSLGSTNQLILSAGFLETAYNEHFTVWIDYNGDGDFLDAGETVTKGNSSSGTNRVANIVIPTNAKLGKTRMRVSMKYGVLPNSCENFGDGEVEDYTVNIISESLNRDSSDFLEENIRVQDEPILSVYPNPAVNFVKVKLVSEASNITYKIVSVQGSVVQIGRLNNSKLNITNLTSGMYILEINDGQKNLTVKLLKK
ncbi:GEVED domain-containing protein [Tenacibaculum pacificus]|uniref:GEVED domain-containing protein n=1 Tax=Tenacibaculum pacificus TaxID=3018314 RepID=UPI0022F3EE66|nr:GEVED domain-containing protein [Tenacibaculum pacificus]WBX73719.1 GEVED domain-containing protein [Tenacibaculum pacificus]